MFKPKYPTHSNISRVLVKSTRVLTVLAFPSTTASFTAMALHPIAILVFSGKRKSGKDHVTNILKERYDQLIEVDI